MRFRRILKRIFREQYFSKKLFFDHLEDNVSDCKTVLELGAGKNSYLRQLNKIFHITAIDLFEPSIESAKENNVYDEYIKGDVKQILNIVEPKSFDCVAAFDLIEHLSKEDGNKLLENMEKIARKKIVIFTPNGFLIQPPHDNNPFQEHLSGWKFDEMEKAKFKVIGINGLRNLRGMFSIPKIHPYEFGVFISNISQIILNFFRLQKYSFAILCVKSVSENTNLVSK
ncbi:MAG: class I SAM-dependent methyltransferase [Leptospiraceae bacterium]|nr:class I SAM-dependent methyltransferase [candidate division KSB1 bacterium]MCP5498215.1 class I SAM-dependent methyltransferase [Leptospiraceae bacterium]